MMYEAVRAAVGQKPRLTSAMPFSVYLDKQTV